MLQEIQLGVPRADAFRNLAERTDVEELNAFALAMIQADVFGVSIASVLRTQAQQLRIKRRQRAEAKAQQTPVKIVFPLILCILPALFVVIVGPGAIRIWESFIQTWRTSPAVRRTRAATLPRDEGRLPGGTRGVQRARRALAVRRRGAAALRDGAARVLARDERRGGFGVVPLENSQAAPSTRPTSCSPTRASSGSWGSRSSASTTRCSGCPARVWRRAPGALHWQALAQCEDFLASMRIEPVPEHDTAGAARKVAEAGDADGAIASVDAATVSGLIVPRSGSRPRENFTKFAIVGGSDPGLGPADKTSMVMAVLDEPGSLLGALQPFAARGINLHKLSRAPARGRVRVPDVRRLHGAGRRPRGGGRAQGGPRAHLDAEDPGLLPLRGRTRLTP